MKLTFPSIMYSTKFLGGLRFCLRWGGGGKFGDVNSLLQLFIYVRSKLEDISILVPALS